MFSIPNNAMLKCFFILLSVTIGILAGPYAHFRKLENVDTTLDVSIAEYTDIPINTCHAMCAAIKLCIYISYHEGQHVCRTHGINRNGIPSQGWRIYFKLLDEGGKTNVNLMNGASAFQSSTYDDFHASLALDGNTDGLLDANTCSHTDNSYSYWIMQFGMSGVVDKVDIYLRTDLTKRNTNRAVMVAQSFHDAVNRVGVECGGYFGPVIDTTPYRLTIQCDGPIFGKFLRITHEMDDLMEICEVIVYTP